MKWEALAQPTIKFTSSPGIFLREKKIKNNSKIQTFPFHLVEPSPWPILTSFALLTLTVSSVMYFHGFANGGVFFVLGLILTAFALVL